MTSTNRIAEIRDGMNLEEHFAYARQRLFKEGSIDSSVLEIFSYLKLFQPLFFQKHESDIIEIMGLYFKKPKPESFISLIFADYGKYIHEEFGEEYTPVQADILKKIQKMQTFSFSAPTSTGKSFVFRNLIKTVDYDVAVIVPSRALINEYYDKVHEIINDKAVNILTFVDIINTKHTKRNVFILTPERARELFKLKDKLNIGLVLFDEAQLSDEDSVRGLYFDSIVRRVQKAFPSAKCIFAHPFVANPEAQLKKNHVDIDENATALQYEQKNVGQIFYTHDKTTGEFHHFGIDKSVMGERKVKALFDPIEKAIKEGGSVLIYVPKKHIYNEQIYIDFKKYIQLCQPITDPSALDLIEKLRDYVGASNGKSVNYFSKTLERLKHGIVVHHGSIPLRARLILEHFTQEGFCRICFATSTLEQGINMPFDVVYLDRFEESKPLSVKNLIGRAGRSTPLSVFDIGAAIIKKDNISPFRSVIIKQEVIEATERIYDILIEHGQYAVGQAQSEYKDWNEDLKARYVFTPIPAEEHPQLLLRDELCDEINQYVREHPNADCSADVFRKTLQNCRVNPQQIKETLIELAGLSVLAAAKEFKRIGHCRDLSAVQSRLRYGFKVYQNRVRLNNKLSDIGNSLMPLFSCSKIETQSEKQSRGESFEGLASECLKGAVLAELSIQQAAEKKQEQGGLCLS